MTTPEQYIKKAESKLKTWFSLTETKYEEAAELFEKAGNLYKINKDWDKAGDCFKRASDCLVISSPLESVTFLINAATCYRKTDIDQAILYYQQAHDISLQNGQFKNAAKYLKEIAEIHETSCEFEKAIDYYKQAGELYKSENEINTSKQCFLKCAHYLSRMGKYEEAITIYEDVANNSIDTTIQKYFVKEYLFKAGLCWLAQEDLVGAKRAVEKYQDLDCSFSSTYECKFIKKLIECIENYDVEQFTNEVVEFDKMMRLDEWKTHILLAIKNQIPKEENTSLT